MRRLKAEIQTNFGRFTTNWRGKQATVATALDAEDTKFEESYVRLVSLQAWRSELFERVIPADALAFFLEAQNDAVLSHVLARMGSWRLALKSLRSLIENTYQCLYYMDHPVELSLWQAGHHRMGRAVLQGYLEAHPQVRGMDANVTGITTLSAEYETLSKAVHASAKGFRMTADLDSTKLFGSEAASLGQWQTRERKVLAGVNQLLLTVFRDELQGSKAPNLRKAISFAIPVAQHAGIKSAHRVILFQP